ncbi:Sec-independent protein translocase subunit TatA/TatB [Verrucomicrobiota bacterium sgz303538]
MNFLALLPNLAGPDGLVIFLIILLLFGAKKLPELAKGLGSAVREFSKAKDDIQSEITRPASQPSPQIESPRDTQPHVATTEQSSTPTTHQA